MVSNISSGGSNIAIAVLCRLWLDHVTAGGIAIAARNS